MSFFRGSSATADQRTLAEFILRLFDDGSERLLQETPGWTGLMRVFRLFGRRGCHSSFCSAWPPRRIAADWFQAAAPYDACFESNARLGVFRSSWGYGAVADSVSTMLRAVEQCHFRFGQEASLLRGQTRSGECRHLEV
jgi:hypothetical protein